MTLFRIQIWLKRRIRALWCWLLRKPQPAYKKVTAADAVKVLQKAYPQEKLNDLFYKESPWRMK